MSQKRIFIWKKILENNLMNKNYRYCKYNVVTTGFSRYKCPNFFQTRRKDMAKPKQKPKKQEETTSEFLKRVNEHKEWGKRNGLKRRTGRHHR